MKKNQIEILQLESTITEQKNLLKGFKNRFEQAEAKSANEDRSDEIIQFDKQTKRMKKNEQSLRDPWNAVLVNAGCYNRIPQT